MNPGTVDLLTPRILVVDDERQIHASLRLRLGRDYDLVFCLSGREALSRLQTERFDLCFADLHMPEMDGFTFIDTARRTDPSLGFVVITAFDTDRNLRRAIPLQVIEFVSKPLPERIDFEARIPDWIAQTRERRRAQELAQKADVLATDRDTARMEREVELVVAETARDALLQTASLQTTIHAHLVSALGILASRAKTDPTLLHALRNLEGAAKTAEASISVVDGFFGSGYGTRDTSPALVNDGVRHAIDIASRLSRTEELNKLVDFVPLDVRLSIRGLSGIEFLLMMVPAISAALGCSAQNATVGIRGEHLSRLDAIFRDPKWRGCVWVNRKKALPSLPAVSLTLSSSGRAFERSEIESWLKGEYEPLDLITACGLVKGVQRCHGLLGISVSPDADHFKLVLVLPI